jgi:hypothetical protein
MTPVIAALLLVAAVIPPAVDATVPGSTAALVSTGSAAASVELDRTNLSTSIGQRFSFTSTVRNQSDQPMPGVVAHLNVLSLDPAVYVDPEDWSSSRTSYIDVLPAHAADRLAWTVQAVNSGRFVIYVAVTTKQGTHDVVASNALRAAVAQRRTLNTGGILPLAVAMPTTVLLLIGFAARRRRRLR